MKNLLKALAAAIADMPDPKKNSKNDHFKNRYADLGAVLECVAGPLAAHGLVLTQMINYSPEASATVLVTTVWHVESGEALPSIVPLVMDKPTAQAQGSAITYARRYAIKALFGLSDVDDDGSMASRPHPAEKQQPKRIETRREPQAASEPAVSAEDLTTYKGLMGSILSAASIPDLRQVGEMIGEMSLDAVVAEKLRAAFGKRKLELERSVP